MTSAAYTLLVSNPSGAQVGVIKSFYSLDIVRAEKKIGVLAADVYMDESDFPKYLVKNNIVDVQRNTPRRTYIWGETRYYLMEWEISQDAEGKKLVHLEFDDANKILDQRIIYWASRTVEALFTAAADNIMKSIITLNYGTGAAVDRRMTTVLSVMTNTSSAPSITKECAKKQVLDALIEICDASEEAGTYLTFDLVPNGGLLEFRTYTGQRGANLGSTSATPTLISLDKKNLLNPKIKVEHRDTKNYIVAGGQDQGTDRIVRSAGNLSLMNSSALGREEGWIDARNGEGPAQVASEAKSELAKRGAKAIFTGQVQETDTFKLDEQFRFGDLVMVKYAGYTFNCRVNPIHISVDSSGKETVDVMLEGETAV
jgi:hypothetical protein